MQPRSVQPEVTGALPEEQHSREGARAMPFLVDELAEVQHAPAGTFHKGRLQGAAIAEVEALLPAGTLHRMPYGCKADVGFTMGQSALYLGVYINAGRAQPRGCVIFHRCKSSSGLWICRPMHSKGGSFVLPGHKVLSAIAITPKQGTKWYPYLVSDELLPEVMGRIYQAVRDKQATCALPSGQALHTSHMQLVPLECLSEPVLIEHKKLEACFQLRQRQLANLNIQRRVVNGLALGAIIEGVRVQDKVAHARPGHQGFVAWPSIEPQVILKDGGGDPSFQLLWVFHPDGSQFWLIPVQTLAAKGCLICKPGEFKSSKMLMLYDLTYQKSGYGRPADVWTQAYCLDSRDPHCEQRVRALLRAAVPSTKGE